MKMRSFIIAAAMMGAALNGKAADVTVASDIAVSTTWTADNVYNMTEQVYVLPGATLTIEAGTVVASDSGSLAVCRGAQIYVQGTRENPVIMTSIYDDFSTWRESANEWGNLTLCGNGLISASHYKGSAVNNSDGVPNGKQPDGLSEKEMEGLSAAYVGDTRHYYGGSNDHDDSGSIKFLSIRYGGKVESLDKELNGLSLGAVGQATDIDYVDIMNNVDDGIEIWGGKVPLKHLSIWNIGDDSLDVDEGWRGQAQFGLIVQGNSLDASQGSGVGDNCIETDGAEDSDAQPVTTAEIYNFTVIGQPVDGDGGTAWRDNARVQYRNCIWMDLGEKLVRFDGDDGDGANGYGYNGTLNWTQTWATAYSALPTNSVGVHPTAIYTSQTEGHLAEITDSLFYNNTHAEAYTEATNVNVFATENKNMIVNDMPIQSITRGAPVSRGGKTILPVTYLNPCAANDAVSSDRVAPNNGFYSQAAYKGAFSSTYNWLAGWTAADQFGMLDTSMNVDPTVALDLGTSITFPSEVGLSYDVEASDSLSNAVWSVIETVEGTGSMMKVVDDNLPNTRFYRVVTK